MSEVMSSVPAEAILEKKFESEAVGVPNPNVIKDWDAEAAERNDLPKGALVAMLQELSEPDIEE
jgi:hypothetical protein